MNKKIGILGGTFDPFHKGHYLLAKTAYEQFGLDEVWIMPNATPPHKKDIKQTGFKLRCEMIRLAIQDAPYMKLCSVEKSEEKYHYTYKTLSEFHAKYPDDEFYFIIGADSLNDFPTWREPKTIAELCTLLVAVRDETGISQLKEKIKEIEKQFEAECLVLNSPKVEAASSKIREMVLEGRDITEYVGKQVRDYIEKQKLYRK